MSTATEAATAPTPGVAPLAAVVPLTDLYPSPSNPRKHFDGLGELALSLARKGVEIPLIVRSRSTAQGALEIIDGERRYRAAQAAGLQFVPVIHRDQMTDADVLEMQLENAMQRSDLTPLEEARGIKALIKSSSATPAEIAKRMSRSERFIADRIRLLDLVPELQQLLDQNRIGVEHAERLAKLSKDDQKRALDPGGDRGRTGGLWTAEQETLDFDVLNDLPDHKRDPYAGLKVATVKELEAWVARHVRFDVDRMATTAPLEFGTVAGQVATAQAKDGRGKKVVEITHDHHLRDDVKDPARRVYGPMSWRRADGTVASVRDGRGRMVDAKTCEYSVLGVVAVGPEYGSAFQVCLARDKCTVHFKAEIAEKAKREQLRAGGQGAQAAKRESTERETYESRQKREEAQKVVDRAIYAKMHGPLVVAVRAAVPPVVIDDGLFAFLWDSIRGGKMPKIAPDARALHMVLAAIPDPDPKEYWPDGDIRRARLVAEYFGVDGAALEKAARAEVKAEAKAAAKAAPAPSDAKAKATAKKPAKKKAAKKR